MLTKTERETIMNLINNPYHHFSNEALLDLASLVQESDLEEYALAKENRLASKSTLTPRDKIIAEFAEETASIFDKLNTALDKEAKPIFRAFRKLIGRNDNEAVEIQR